MAGNGTWGFSGDGGPATSAELNFPFGVTVDSAGNLFVADPNNNRIRRVDATSSTITTIAGGGSGGDGGPATSGVLFSPSGVAADSTGNHFAADTGNNRIRRVDAVTQMISTVAGNGTAGFSGDGGPATSAALDNPHGAAVDSAGNLFIAEWGNSRIRRVDAVTQMISTVAGNGARGFSGDGGPATSAVLNMPKGAAVDSDGNVFIADTGNSRIRRVDAVTQMISTVAGNGTEFFSGDGGPATSAGLDPFGVALDSAGNLFSADTSNNRIRKVELPPFVVLGPANLTFGNQSLGTTGSAQAVKLQNTGLIPLVISSIAVSAGLRETNDCGGSVAANSYCTLNVSFAPTVAGAQSGSLTVTDNSFGSPHSVSLGGTGTGPMVSLGPPPTFLSEALGSTSPAQTVTVTNTGNANLTFTAIGVTGPFDIATSGTTCSTSSPVAASASCTVAITFTPTAGGAASGNLSFTDNAAGSPQTLALSGTGQDFTLAVSSGSSSTQTVSRGGSATYTLTVASLGGFNQAVSLACSGAPSESTCQLSQTSLTPSGSGTNVTVTVTTTAPSVSTPRSRHLPPAQPLLPKCGQHDRARSVSGWPLLCGRNSITTAGWPAADCVGGLRPGNATGRGRLWRRRWWRRRGR